MARIWSTYVYKLSVMVPWFKNDNTVDQFYQGAGRIKHDLDWLRLAHVFNHTCDDFLIFKHAVKLLGLPNH